MAAKYDEIDRVSVVHDDVPVELKLQRRLDVGPYIFVCWRTRYQSAPKKSRRFYSSGGTGFWTIPVRIALDLVRQASERGLLDAKYDQSGVRSIDSRVLDSDARQRLRPTIVCNKGGPEWGADPLFVICHGGDDSWREIMILDTEREFCTFRCTTTNTQYKVGIFADRLEGPWRLDNAMQDADPGSMREFLRVLEEISE